MQKVITVTQRHINKGQRNEGDSCPVARALLDSGFKTVYVDDESFFGRLINGQDTIRGDVPRSVARFVNKFDKLGKKAVKPFNFKLNIKE